MATRAVIKVGTSSVTTERGDLDLGKEVLNRHGVVHGGILALLVDCALGTALRAWSPDHVIVEQAIKNLETYPLVLRRTVSGGPRIAMWGQGRSFSTAQSPCEASFKQWLTRRCDRSGKDNVPHEIVMMPPGWLPE